MTNKNKNKKRPTGYRGPNPGARAERAAQAPSRRGLLDGLFSPLMGASSAARSGASTMPKTSTSVGRGVVAAASSPAIVGCVVLSVFAGWLGAIALGFQGPFSVMASFLALPPVGTSFDIAMTTRVFGSSGIIGIFVFIGIRAVLMAVITSLAVDSLREARSDRWSVIRGLRILPVTVAVNLLSLGLTMVGTILSGFLGAGIGLIVAIAVFAVGVYLLTFAPVIAVAESRSMPESLARSVRAARMPGSSNLTLASIYALAAIAVFFGGGRGKLGVNPLPAAWALVLFLNFLQIAMLTAFAFRYLSVADEVPDAPAPRPKASPRR